MGCGASNNASNVQEPTLTKKSTLPAIPTKEKSKTPSAKSNGSADSGIEDSDPPKTKTSPSKIPLPIDSLLVEHQKKSRLGNGETFEIILGEKPGALAPLKNPPKFRASKLPPIETDLQAKLAEKQERASRKRQEIEDARRLASSRIGHRSTGVKREPLEPITTDDPFSHKLKREERRQQLTMLRDQLRQNGSNNSLYDPMHTPRTPRGDSAASGMSDIANMTPRRAGLVIGATAATNFKPVYD